VVRSIFAETSNRVLRVAKPATTPVPLRGTSPSELRRGAYSIKVLLDCLQHTFQIFKYQSILEAYSADLQTPDKFVTRDIILRPDRSEMRLTIQLDGQPAFRTVKVQDVLPDTVLSAKLFSIQP
jgi:hypothetical protein